MMRGKVFSNSWCSVGVALSLAVCVTALLGSVASAQAPGTVLRDCAECPEMVVIPAGTMRPNSGSHIRIEKSFLVGKYEVTFVEWEHCVAAGGCFQRPDDRGFGRGRRPVIDVSWLDAQRYAEWLRSKTKKPYRLLHGAEWLYAATSGGRHASPPLGLGLANCGGLSWQCGSRWDGKSTAPVGSFPANSFGLHDMYGNVWEWTIDCAERSYVVGGGCRKHSLRGYGWGTVMVPLDTEAATYDYPDHRAYDVGFRVARPL
jgi:formylglycine-generating enzyme required for sulfatase activity